MLRAYRGNSCDLMYCSGYNRGCFKHDAFFTLLLESFFSLILQSLEVPGLYINSSYTIMMLSHNVEWSFLFFFFTCRYK